MNKTSQEARQIAEQAINYMRENVFPSTEDKDGYYYDRDWEKEKAACLANFPEEKDESKNNDLREAKSEIRGAVLDAVHKWTDDHKTGCDERLLLELQNIVIKQFERFQFSYVRTRFDAPTAGDGDWHEIAENFVMDVTNDNMVFSSPRYVTNKLTELLSKLSPAPQNEAGDNWISVDSGKLPEDCDDVYFFCAGQVHDGTYFMYEDQNIFTSNTTKVNFIESVVSYWMPKSLPSPPSATAEQDKK